MRRIVLAGGVLVAFAVAVVVVAAQPPVAPLAPPAALPPAPPPVAPPTPPREVLPPTPPQPLPVPGAAAPPSANAETPLSKLQPLEAFPAATQFAVRGVLLGSKWMAESNQPHGRFIYGYLPALRQRMSGDNDLNQAQAALAMAQAARFSGDKKTAARASQAILVLLASTKIDPADANCRVPVQLSFVCNRVGYAATIALAIYELPNASDKDIDDAERLCAFLRKQLRADGSVHYTDGATDVSTRTDPAGVNEYPGVALHALARSNRVRPAAWKTDAVKRGVVYYRTAFRAKPHPMLAATVTPAATELYLQTKLPDALAAAYEMNDWLCGVQIAATDPRTPQWAGGFREGVNGRTASTSPGAAKTGLYLHSLACAYQLTRMTADLQREAKYRLAAMDTVRFLCGLQFLEVNTRHFENNFRATMLIGAFHVSPANGNIRIDATARAVTGLLRFLSCGAERGGL